jgi:hypothetical protein
MTVIGEAVSSVVIFIRKRPSEATSHRGLIFPATLDALPLEIAVNDALIVRRL